VLKLITGTPGAGKTLLAVWEIWTAVTAGRLVYARVEGINIPGVQPFPESGWTCCADGSLIVIDEAQECWPADKDRVSALPKTEIEAMERSRHRGIDLILITQDPRLINAHILHLVGNHRHLCRVMGTANVRLYTMDSCSERLSKSELRAGLLVPWRHPKSVFSMYKSAQLHPPKQRLPTAVLAVIGFVPLALGFGAYGLGNFFGAWDADQVVANGRTEVTQALVARVVPEAEKNLGLVVRLPRENITGCYADRLRCRCVGPGGSQVSEAECRGIIGAPIRTAASAEVWAGRAGERGAQRSSGASSASPGLPGRLLAGAGVSR
jgi:zona occludens toxin (predicted ATPase)